MFFFVTFVPYQQQHETTQRIFVLASLYTVSPPPRSQHWLLIGEARSLHQKW